MNLLLLKTIAYNPVTDKLYSPSHTGFAWSKGVVARACTRCTMDTCDPYCTCGIYGSPNPEALNEYHKYVNSIFVLMNTYGWVDIWSAPRNVLGGCALVTRAWGTQVVGIVSYEPKGEYNTPRGITMMRAAELFEVSVYPWKMVRKLIQVNWANVEGLVISDPYDKEAIARWK